MDFPAEHKGKRKGDEMLVRRDPTDDPISLTCRKTHSDDHFCPAGRQRGGRRVKQPGVRIELPLEGENPPHVISDYRNSEEYSLYLQGQNQAGRRGQTSSPGSTPPV